MYQKRICMEKMVAVMMIAYTLCVILGETLRDQRFPEDSPKRKSFSGPFLWLKAKLSLSYCACFRFAKKP
jgi:hypothetical protein